MYNNGQSLPSDRQFVLVEDASGQKAVARWSHKFQAWFGPDGEPIIVDPKSWRPLPEGGLAGVDARAPSTPEYVPDDGQLVIVEDVGGGETLARWAHEIEAWVGVDGKPIVIRPQTWRVVPSLDRPPPSSLSATKKQQQDAKNRAALDSLSAKILAREKGPIFVATVSNEHLVPAAGQVDHKLPIEPDGKKPVVATLDIDPLFDEVAGPSNGAPVEGSSPSLQSLK